MMIDRATMMAALLLASAPAASATAPIPAKPIGDPASWISSDDYPASALRASQEGDVRIMLDVGADGQFTCSVIASSNVPALDEASCALLTARARFEPAHDQHDQPVAAHWSRTIRWRIPTGSGVDVSTVHLLSCPPGRRDEIQIETAYGCYR